MSQNNVNYADNPTGPQLMDNYLAKSQENRLTTNSGVQRPTYAKAGTFWINSSANPWVLYFYNGSIDVAIGTIGTGSSGTFNVEGVDLSDYVTTNTQQTIGGQKTFSDPIRYRGTAGLTYNSIHSSATKGTTPTSNANSTFSFLDSTFSSSYNATISRTQYGYDTGGKTFAKLQAFKPTSASTQIGTIAVYYPSTGDPYTEAPTPATSDNSTKIATTAYVKAQGYALDGDVVKTSDNQTIAGYKTFTNSINSNVNQYAINIRQTDLAKGSNPSSTIAKQITFYDNSGSTGTSHAFGGLQFVLTDNGETRVNLLAYKNEADSSRNAVLGIRYPSTGDPYTEAPTPATSDNSTKIATTAFVNSRITDVLTTSGAGLAEFSLTNNGYCKFSNGLIIQWGRNNNNTSSTLFTINFSIPFTASNSYGLVTTCTNSNLSASGRGYTTNSATTSVDVVCESSYAPVKWIAIGY